MSDKLGSRIGPRIASMVADAMTAHKRQSMDTDVDLRHMANWKTLTGLGAEMGDLFNGIYSPVLKDIDVLPPEMARVLKIAATGKHQGYSIGAGSAIGLALSPLSTIFSNTMAPLVYRVVGASPQLIPDLDQLLQMAVQGIIGAQDLVHFASWLGYDSGWVDKLTEATFAQPGLAQYYALKNRNLINGAEATQMLTRFGYHSNIAPLIDAMSQQLLSPADMALAVLRGVVSDEHGRKVSAMSGVGSEDFDVLIGNTGEPPGLAELLLLWRRGNITTERLDTGIRQSRVRNEWVEDVHKLAILPPSTAEAVTAVVESQTDEAEGLRRFTEAGGDPDWWPIAVGITGAAPSPNELGVLANRGLIPWEGTGKDVVSFTQGVFEGRSKNKYLKAWKDLAVYLPPPRTIVALIKQNALDTETALDLLQKQGLTHELAAAYVNGAKAEKLVAHKTLSVATIESLYQERGIDRETATAMLKAEGYDDIEVGYMLWLSDFQSYKKAFDAALAKVQAAYVGHKIDRNTAGTSLDALLVPDGQKETLLTIWSFAREANVKTLTTAEIRSAFKKEIIAQDEAQQRLIEQGYSDADAAILLQL